MISSVQSDCTRGAGPQAGGVDGCLARPGLLRHESAHYWSAQL